MRTELSGTVFEHWVAKTTNWLDAEFGDGVRLHLQLRAHWLWPVFIAALDELQGAVTPAESADAVVRVGASLDASLPVIAIHEHPMALPFRDELPPHHYDFFRDVRSGGDARGAGPTHDEPLLDNGIRSFSAADLLAMTPAAPSQQRIALEVDSHDLETAEQLATLALMPWRAQSSLVIFDGTSSVAGERTTLEIALPHA